MSRPAALPAPLRRLAALYGVQTSYLDDQKRRKTASPDILTDVLRALGAPLDSPGDAATALTEREREMASSLAEPVHVAWDGESSQLAIRNRARPVACALTLESGESREWTADGRNLPTAVAPGTALLPLPELPFGYHHLRLEAGAAVADCLVISAPRRAWGGTPEEHAWGVFAPLHALRSAGDWGTGGLGELERLANWAAGLGAGYFGTLPLFASYLGEPFTPSPYSPVSRLFWNEMYIDVERLPELSFSENARALVASPEFRRGLEALRSTPLVDYRSVMTAKRRVLETLISDLPEERREQLRLIAAGRPELADYARFRAMVERRVAPMPRRANGDALCSYSEDYDRDAATYHEYVQLVMEEQLSGMREKASARGIRLYFDLPLGAHPAGYDAWRFVESFAAGISTGAPPDSMFVQGQDWAFPPMHPEAIRRHGYDYFRAVVRNAMRFAGLLRLDHVMGLHRLFWIPKGATAREGVYVRYAPEELYAIICLESHRAQVSVIGEDLGTVPVYIRPAMRRHNVYGMYVMQFQVPEKGEPQAPGVRQVAALNTHDMPPFASWLRAGDVEENIRHGIMTADVATTTRRSRERQRRSLAQALKQRGLVAGGATPEALLGGGLRALARSRTPLLLVNLEDLWLETEPQNVPGTSDEQRPNWRRKAARTLEELEDDEGSTGLLRSIDAGRRAAHSR